jgi:hypothetical protein
MTDKSDNMTRMYPQALMKQFRNLTERPQYAAFDINGKFNSDVNWYFDVSYMKLDNANSKVVTNSLVSRPSNTAQWNSYQHTNRLPSHRNPRVCPWPWIFEFVE